MADTDFFERLKENPRPVVVDFWASWCGPCRSIEPFLRRLDKEYQDQVDLWRINADENPDILSNLGISGIPTLIAFRNGQEIVRITGASSFDILAAVFENALSGEPLPEILSKPMSLMRILIGLALLLLAYSGHFTGVYLLAMILGGLFLLSGFYDFYPAWQIIVPRLRALIGDSKDTHNQGKDQ
jgi:thioredoxin